MILTGCANDSTESVAITAEHEGLKVYTKYCASCHNAGVADAPKLGSLDEWQARVTKGKETMLQSTINGIPPGMPKRGLCLSCSDEELAVAIDYMLEQLETAESTTESG